MNRVTAAFVNGPSAGERDNVSDPPPRTIDREVLLNPIDGYPIEEGQPFVDSTWEKHRYRFAAIGWFRSESSVALYEYVGPVEELA